MSIYRVIIPADKFSLLENASIATNILYQEGVRKALKDLDWSDEEINDIDWNKPLDLCCQIVGKADNTESKSDSISASIELFSFEMDGDIENLSGEFKKLSSQSFVFPKLFSTSTGEFLQTGEFSLLLTTMEPKPYGDPENFIVVPCCKELLNAVVDSLGINRHSIDLYPVKIMFTAPDGTVPVQAQEVSKDISEKVNHAVKYLLLAVDGGGDLWQLDINEIAVVDEDGDTLLKTSISCSPPPDSAEEAEAEEAPESGVFAP